MEIPWRYNYIWPKFTDYSCNFRQIGKLFVTATEIIPSFHPCYLRLGRSSDIIRLRNISDY